MAIWRESVNSTTEAEIDGLVRATVGHVHTSLATRGSIRSCMVATTHDGEIEICEDDIERNGNTLANRVQMRPGDYSAVAYVIDEPGQCEIQVGVEHCDGIAITVFGPYRTNQQSGAVSFREFRSEMAPPTMWKKPHLVAV